MNKSVQTKLQHGFAHLVLLFVIFVLAIGALLYFVVFKKDVSDLTNMYKTSPSITQAPKSLEEEANEIPDDDPSKDFTEVDNDISIL
jgi:hypothetical protein